MLSFELVQDQERGTWNNVKLFGKKIAKQSRGGGGKFFGCKWHYTFTVWHIAGLKIKTFPPGKIVPNFTKYGLIPELKHAVKAFFAVRSGFVQMENKYHDGDWWYWIEAEPNGYDDSYYTCARFGNGRHIPLPILANWDEDSNKLQKFAIRLAGGAKDAVREALRYEPATWNG